MTELPNPLNVEEKYLYAIVKKLDRVIELLEEGLTKNQIIDRLNDKNVNFDPKAKKQELLDLLKSVEE